MTKGAPADQERAVARALEAGVNHFDTAAVLWRRCVGAEYRPRAR
jgi:diketogulonate reductase-like aldo/keto reductase